MHDFDQQQTCKTAATSFFWGKARFARSELSNHPLLRWSWSWSWSWTLLMLVGPYVSKTDSRVTQCSQEMTLVLSTSKI